MSTLVRSVFNRRTLPLVGAFLVVAVVAGFLTPQPTQADRCGTEFIYYNSTWTEVVGYRAWLPYECNCALQSWGSVTSNREINDAGC